MRILAINGSPRGRKSNTERILQAFLAGAEEAGARAETLYLSEMEIRPCRGCFTCWTKTPGVCVHRDDMAAILPRLHEADALVYATPLYVFTVSGLMKHFLDRHLPLVDPHLAWREGHLTHPPRYPRPEGSRQKVVLISNSGFPERHHFSALLETFRRFTDNPYQELAAVILCAGGELLRQPALADTLRWYPDAAREAGRQFVLYGRIREETQQFLDTPLAEAEVYARMANLYWDSHPAGAETQEQPQSPAPDREELSPPLPLPSTPPGEAPTTVYEAIAGMALAFDPAAAGNLQADVQFLVSGAEPGTYVLRLRSGRCTVHRGTVTRPHLTIRTPSEVWVKIARGELSGQTAYVKGMYQVEGDFGLLLRLADLFPGPQGRSRPTEPAAASAPEPAPQPATPEPTPAGPIRLPGMAWLTLAFLPWIAFWATEDLPILGEGVRLGLPLALAATLWFYRRRYRQATWMETGSALYFFLLAAATLAGSDFFRHYREVLGYLALAGLWFGTLATEVPLTAEYSKWSYPPALWRQPVFLRTNAVITAVWGGIYLVQAALALAENAAGPAWEWILARNLLLVPGLAFTAWFKDWYPAYGSLRPPGPPHGNG
ncbi:MAG: NAD(P)H-dependent oxidoreductase [Moorellales bacterium]